jgi:hypothetical protein
MKSAFCTSKLASFLLVAAMFVLPSLVSAAEVKSATISGNQLTISGTFVLPIKSVELGSTNLTLISETTSEVVAQLSPIPPIGMYYIAVKDAKGSSQSSMQVQAKTLEGWVNSDGAIGSGSGFTVTRNSAGNYTVSWPAGTLYQCCGTLPPVVVRSTWGNALGNIQYIYHYGDGAGTFTVDFGGVDTYFIFSMTQTY